MEMYVDFYLFSFAFFCFMFDSNCRVDVNDLLISCVLLCDDGKLFNDEFIFSHFSSRLFSLTIDGSVGDSSIE